jgi:hypothetical protein
MLFVHGAKLYGRVDEVPGLFYVATLFSHINFIPLLPRGSFVVIPPADQTVSPAAHRGGGRRPVVIRQPAREVPIRLSGKSVLMAWGQAILWSVAVVAALWAGYESTDPLRPQWEVPLSVAVVALALASVITWHGGLRRASFERALELAKTAGLDEAQMGAIYKHYNRVPPPRSANPA